MHAPQTKRHNDCLHGRAGSDGGRLSGRKRKTATGGWDSAEKALDASMRTFKCTAPASSSKSKIMS
jgi:hypothetical protein